jgi:bacterial/archaeal transporter family protein
MGSLKNNLPVIIFAFIGMVCWGITPLFVKLGLRNMDAHVGLAIRTATTTIILTGWMICDGSFSKLTQVSTVAVIFLILEAVVATFIGDLAYFAAIKHGEVSLVVIILSCSPLVTMLLSTIFLNEAITVTRIIGAFMIIGGIILAMK